MQWIIFETGGDRRCEWDDTFIGTSILFKEPLVCKAVCLESPLFWQWFGKSLLNDLFGEYWKRFVWRKFVLRVCFLFSKPLFGKSFILFGKCFISKAVCLGSYLIWKLFVCRVICLSADLLIKCVPRPFVYKQNICLKRVENRWITRPSRWGQYYQHAVHIIF